MITERVMAVGDWEVELDPTIPRSVLADIGPAYFGHLLVTPAALDPRSLDSTEILAAARYTGIYRTRPSELRIGGSGLAAWLGDEDGKGLLIEAVFTHTDEDFDTLSAAFIPSTLITNDVTGTVPGTATYANEFGTTYRKNLDAVVALFGAEWRVNADGTVDRGLAADLYGDPSAVVIRRGGGRDIGLTGVDVELDAATDVEDLVTRVIVVTDTGNGSADLSPPTTFLDLHGDPVVITKIVTDSNAAGNEDAVAAAELAANESPHTEISLDTELYDVTGTIRSGGSIYLFDPELGFVDETNLIAYRGEQIAPIVIRVSGVSWSVARGMGFYFRHGDGRIVDLTEWIVTEDSPSRIEVGAPSRTLGSALGP